MPILIDGHNLISALPDIDLDDPHDEAKLVEKLKGYCGRTGKRCTVIFDGGLPGGLSRDLSTGQVKVVFAAASYTDADTLLRGRIRKATDPGGMILVSSDHAVQAAARERRATVTDSQTFAAQMAATMMGAADDGDETDDDVQLDPAEVDEWLRLFSQDKDGGSGAG